MSTIPGFADIHQHILYGMDDGPSTMSAMAAMLDAAVKDGTKAIVATPHAQPGIRPFNRKLCKERLLCARQYCREKHYALQILEGAEILYTSSTMQELARGRIPTLNGTDYALVEWPVKTDVIHISNDLRSLTNEGLVPVIAHTERLQCFRRNIAQLIKLRNMLEIRIQINAHTVLEPANFQVRRFVQRLFREEAVDYIASDAHDTAYRKTRMREAYNHIAKEYGTSAARKTVFENQCEIIQRDR